MKNYLNPSVEIIMISESDIVRTSLQVGNRDDGIDMEINHPDSNG